jgi:hypothetical protein
MKAEPKPIVQAPDPASRSLPPGHRVLHVVVPEDVFNGAKARALLMGIDWPKFVVQLLSKAALSMDDFLVLHDHPEPASE